MVFNLSKEIFVLTLFSRKMRKRSPKNTFSYFGVGELSEKEAKVLIALKGFGLKLKD